MSVFKKEAVLRMGARKTSSIAAQSAHYDKARGRVVVILANEMELSFAPTTAQGLETATPAQLKHIQISPSGSGIHFPKLDADLSVPGLLKGIWDHADGWRRASTAEMDVGVHLKASWPKKHRVPADAKRRNPDSDSFPPHSICNSIASAESSVMMPARCAKPRP